MDMPREHALELLRGMVRIRRLEEKSAELYGAGKIRGFLHLYVGEEAVAVGALAALASDDAVVATYREHGHALMRGVPAAAIMAEMFGKVTGCSRGRGGSMHLFCAEKRFYGGNAIVGGGLPVAVGLALADRMQRKRRLTACFFGDGATDEGEFGESLNLAALWQLPVLFLCENNRYAMGTALARHQSDTVLTHRPMAYGIPSETVDGMDVAAVERTVRYAADRVREEGTPRFVELQTYRYRAHSMFDAERYRDKAEVEQWRERDPIEQWIRVLREKGMASEADIERIEQDVAVEIEEAVAAAEAGAWEPIEDLAKDVLAREVP